MKIKAGLLLILITIGIIHVIGGMVFPDTSYSASYTKTVELPLRIIIPNAEINTNIKESYIEKGTWQVHKKYAGFGLGSSFINEENGNSIIFAHARKNLFKTLDKAKVGSEVIVMGQDKIYTYVVTKRDLISPKEVEVVTSGRETNLTLFTCNGDFDEERLVIKAVKINEKDYPSSESLVI